MSKLKEIIIALPIEKDFHAAEIAQRVYPDNVKQGTEGRVYNTATATVSRLLRQTRGVIDLGDNMFWADNMVRELKSKSIYNSLAHLMDQKKLYESKIKDLDSKISNIEQDIESWRG